MREGGPVRENPLPRYGAGFFYLTVPRTLRGNRWKFRSPSGPSPGRRGDGADRPLRGNERYRELLSPGYEVIEGSFQLSVGRK